MRLYLKSPLHIADCSIMNPVRCIKSKGPGGRAIFFTLMWLVFITVLHDLKQPPASDAQGVEAALKVGFLPITCHLICPVTEDRLRGSDREFRTVKFSSWPDMIDAVRGGEIDIAFILAPIAIALREQGVPVRIVLLGHRDGTALVVNRASGITRIAQLEGRRVGIPIRFSTQNLELLKLCEAAGVNTNHMEVLEIPPPDMPAALDSGGIDAYIVGEPYAAQAELAGTGRVLAEMRDVAPGFISSVIIVREPVMKRYPRRVHGLIREFAVSAKWIEGHRHQAAIIGAEAYGLPEKLLDHVLTSPSDRVSYDNLVPDPAEIGAIGADMVHWKLLQHVPPGREMIDLSWQ